MLTKYEWLHLISEPFLPVLVSKTRRDIRQLLEQTVAQVPCQVLDVGGRKSPYTVGLPADVTLLDIPRESEMQTKLNLGLTHGLLQQLRKRRSNITAVTLQDMTQCTLPTASYDGVICVEVIEHVPHDKALVTQIARVLKPGGWLYMTTPNGDYIRNEPPNHNPDHIRHYKRAELDDLLNQHFDNVSVKWGIKTGKYRFRGLRPVSWRRPLKSVEVMINNVISHIESRDLDEQPKRTAHLFAVAYKPQSA